MLSLETLKILLNSGRESIEFANKDLESQSQKLILLEPMFLS